MTNIPGAAPGSPGAKSEFIGLGGSASGGIALRLPNPGHDDSPASHRPRRPRLRRLLGRPPGASFRAQAPAPIQAAVRRRATPPGTRVSSLVSRESYYHAIECGKSGEAQSPCVFYDAGLCTNKSLRWRCTRPISRWHTKCGWRRAASASRRCPVTRPPGRRGWCWVSRPSASTKNPLTRVAIKRGGRTIPPRGVDPGRRRGHVHLRLSRLRALGRHHAGIDGQVRTRSCVLSPAVLARFR